MNYNAEASFDKLGPAGIYFFTFGRRHTFMNAEPEPDSPRVEKQTLPAFFLVVSVFTGGFNFKLWSMLDTALMIQSIGVTALVVVLEEARYRRLAFKVAIVLYLLAVVDMGINVCISGVVGWKT